MTSKTPISALQEYAAIKKIQAPIYIEEGSGPIFNCTVFVDNIKGEGCASTKKQAKHESASNALQKLGISQKSSEVKMFVYASPKVSPFKNVRNFVGELNELSSKKGLHYPEYELIGISGAHFIFKCKFTDKESVGKGTNKKDAKQEAAMNMLELVKADSTPLIPTVQSLVQQKPIITDKDFLIDMYKALTLSKPEKKEAIPTVLETTSTKIPDLITSDFETTDVLKARIAKIGLTYSIHELQRHPYIMYAKIDNTELCFMECDKLKDEAVRKVLKQIADATKCGVSLKNNDLISLI